jgi:hypothetical protein
VADDPVLAQARDILGESFAEVRRCLADLPQAALVWCPTADETNSLAVLTSHALGSTREWLCVALDQPPPPRVRAEEFGAAFPDADAARRHAEAVIGDCERVLAAGQIDDWGRLRQRANGETVTAAWAILHAIDHLREHVGQMMLTRQLWQAQAAR